MDEYQVAWNDKVAEKLIGKLEKRRMEGSYAATAAQAKDEVVAMIPPGSSVIPMLDYDCDICWTLGSYCRTS